MSTTPRDILPTYGKGDRLTAADLNALIEFVRGRGTTSGRRAFSDAVGETQRSNRRLRDANSWYRCELVGADVITYSILEITDSRLDNGEVVLTVEQPSIGATRFCGNEGFEIAEDGKGWVKLITPYDYVIVRSSGSIGAFSLLSPVADTGFDVEADGASTCLLVALSASNADDLIAVQALSGSSVAGELVTLVSEVECIDGDIVVTDVEVRVIEVTPP